MIADNTPLLSFIFERLDNIKYPDNNKGGIFKEDNRFILPFLQNFEGKTPLEICFAKENYLAAELFIN